MIFSSIYYLKGWKYFQLMCPFFSYLKQVRKNRDEERELMKNDPEWEVGTYYGEPIYITRPEGEFREQEFNEFYAHSWSESISERMFRRHRC